MVQLKQRRVVFSEEWNYVLSQRANNFEGGGLTRRVDWFLGEDHSCFLPTLHPQPIYDLLFINDL